jgi:PAS domain S-box-containing protein
MDKASILIAEGKSRVALDLINWLKRLGYTVSAVAASGEEAIQKASDLGPDLVLMDIKLKGVVDGLDAAEEIRHRFDIPVVYLTAYTDEETLQRAKITRPFGYIIKPFDERTLHSTVEMALHSHRIERKLRESEARYRAVVEDQTEFICRFQPHGTLTFVNQAYCRYFQKEAGELIGHGIMPLILEEDRELVREKFASLSLDQPVINYEHRVVMPDGEIRWQEWTERAIFDQAGNLTEYQSVGRDITERKRMERAVEERQLYLEGVLSATPDAIVTMDTEHQIVEWNQGAERLFGYSSEEATGRELHQLVAGSDSRMFDQAAGYVQQVLAGEALPPTETIHYRKDGTPVNVILASAPVTVNDKMVGLVAAYTDITERKRMEEALRESEERYRTILETIEDGYYEVDIAGNMTFFNPALCEILGYPEDELLGMNNREYMDDETTHDVYQTFNSVYRSGKPSKAFDWEVLQKDGTRKVIEASISLVEDTEGNPVGFRGVARDVTERKQMEQALRERTEQLEALRDVGLEITAQLDLDTLLHSITSQAIELLGGVAGGLYMYRPEQDVLEFVTTVGQRTVPLGSQLHSNEGLAGKVWKNGEAIIVDDYRTWEGHALKYEGLPITSVVGVPICWGEELLGVLTTEGQAPETFSPADAELLSLFASQAAIAIRNARLYEETERRATQARLIYEVGQHVSSELELDVLLSTVVSAVYNAFDYHNVILLLLDEEKDRLTMQSIIGAYADILPDNLTLAVGEGMIGYATASGETQFSNDVSKDPHYVRKAEEDTRSELAVPIKSGRKVIGVLDLQDDELGAFDEIDMTTMETLSTQIAKAIENAHLFQAERKRSAQLATVSKVAESIASTLDPHEVLHRTVEMITQNFGYYYASIMLLDPESNELVFEAGAGGFADKTPSDFRQQLKEGMIGWSAYLGETILSNDVRQEPRYIPAYLTNTQSELDIPLKYHDRLIGVLDLQSRELNAFDEHDVIAMETLAGHVAAAIENARLHEETQQRALEQETLREAALAMTTALERNKVVERILAQLQEVVPYDTASVQLLRDDLLEIVGGRGFPNLEELLAFTFDLDCTDNPNREVIHNRAPFIVEDAPAMYKEFRRTPHSQAHIRSWLGVPMIVGDQLIGMIALDKNEADFYTEEHARLAEAFAAQAAVAFENARLYGELRGYADHLEERVTERTEQLRAQFAQLEAILDSTVDGIVVTSADGELILANHVFQKWIHQTFSPKEAEMLQEGVKDLVRQTLGPRSKLEKEKRPRKVLELTGLDLELIAAPIIEADTSWAKAVVAIHDVSHLKALNRMKSRFVSNVSHELRTPITTIKLYAHLMKEQPENWRDYLAPLDREADHQVQLVEDILEISHADVGRLDVDPRPTDLNTLIDILVDNHDTRIRERGLTLECRKMEKGPIALLDSQRIMQVLNNLMMNAIRYTPEEGSIRISTDKANAHGRTWATVTVKDTGMGIPEEELPHIFERFFRGERPRMMQTSGTGLGLAIVKEIVELHGGLVTVESEVDVGSEFTVWLPMPGE